EADTALLEQARRLDRAAVVRLLELLGAAMEGVHAGADPRTRLELALVKAARPDLDGSTQALLPRIGRVGGRLAGGGREPGPPKAAARAGAAQKRGSEPTARGVEASALRAAEPEGEGEEGELGSVRSLWPAVVERVRAGNVLLGALIAEAQPVALA